jgi:hypothetical protein
MMNAMSIGPRLLASRLIRRNRAAQNRRRWIVAGCLGAFALALGFTFQPTLADTLDTLVRHILMASVLVAVASAAVIARNRQVTRAEFARSWLASLPVRRAIARHDALKIELFPVVAGIAAVTLVMVLAEVALVASRHGAATEPWVVWLWFSVAILVGAGVSYAVPKPKTIELPPGSRYVPKTQSQRGRVLRPSLSALGHWPVRQMFARAQPKLIARALMPVLLSIGLQSKADTAMVVVGLFAACGALALLIPSAIAVSRAAQRWLLPLPLRRRTLLRAVLTRTLGVVLGISAAAGFLMTVMDAPYATAFRVAAVLAIGAIAVALLGVWRAVSTSRA